MRDSGQLTAVLDANVLYPAPVRDILLSFAREKLFQPKWTDKFNEEWSVNLKKNRPDITSTAIKNTVNQMNTAFPDAKINGYESWIDQLELPDKNDRHVLAAAIRGKADVIVTFNLDDFPVSTLQKFEIEPIHPDDFIVNLIDIAPEKSRIALNKLVERLKNPPLDVENVLNMFERCGLGKTVSKYILEVLKK